MEETKKGWKKQLIAFLKKETILCIAAVLALLSLFLVPPDAGYAEYIDISTLGLLFTLMVVMEGLRTLGVFDTIAHVMLGKANSLRRLAYSLVFLCFFCAMLITNDVALITFVPFTLLLLSLAGQKEQAIPIVVLETVAANLGSMLTPVGNPQNLYLYSVSGMELLHFLSVTAPIAAISAVLLIFACLRIPKLPIRLELAEENEENKQEEGKGKRFKIIFFLLIFLLALLTVLKILPLWIPFLLALVGTLIVMRGVLLRVDYCLLLTFVCFFVFIGNVGRIDAVSTFLKAALTGREILLSFLASQIISNVPATVLLSGFTENFEGLLVGANIGGLGTLIASLASLISYKYFAQAEPQKKGKYLWHFTLVNIVFAVILLAFALLLY